MLTSLPPALSLLLFIACVDAAPSSLNPRSSLPLPPGTIDAARDRIPGTVQISGIVAGYVGTVLIWGILLLTIGRKMRRKNSSTPKSLEIELVTARPTAHTNLVSPISARSATSWFKKGFKNKNETSESLAMSQPQSPSIISSPTKGDPKAMEAERERARAEMERLYAAVAEHDKQKHMSQNSAGEQDIEAFQQRPAPRINTSLKPNYSNPSSPVVAIYPPSYHHNNQHNTSPPRERLREQPPASPRSILSKKSIASTGSSNSKARFNLKKLRISGPVQRYPGSADDEEARTPLSPRFANPMAPPSPPTQQNSPTTPGEFEAYEQLDEVQPLPRPAPQRLGSFNQTPTALNAPVLSKSANSSTHELPLRGYAEPLKSPDLRTTVLDRRLDKLSLNTPKTSVPYTPYSPYMPFSPITPVTPHLVTRAERKQRKKREINDPSQMVQSPKEIFGDSY